VSFDDVRAAAFDVKWLLDELGVASFPKTTGSKGIHIHVALGARWDSYDVRRATVAMARELERRHPDRLTSAWWKEDRRTRVFIDFNQNAPHKTVFGAWSVRARVGAQLSTPVTWDELPEVEIDALTMPVVIDRLSRLGEPWAGLHADPQDISPLRDMASADTERGLPDAPWPPQYPKMPNEPPRVAPSRAKQS
jgi:DNA primase